MNGRHARLRGLLLGALFVLCAGTFLFWHLSHPSDGARLEPGQQVWRPDGVVVTPVGERPTALLPGDIVSAVDGRSLQAWTEGLFQPGSARLSPTWGSPLRYTVKRDGRQIHVTISPGPYPLGAILLQNWSTLLFTLFVQVVMLVVFLLRPHDRAARALFVLAFSLSHDYVYVLGLQVADITSGVGYWLYQLSSVGLWLVTWSATVEFALVFPRVHPVMRGRPWLIRTIYPASFATFLGYLLLTRVLSPSILDWVGGWLAGTWLVAVILEALTAFSIITGYRSTRDNEAHAKVRWLIFAFAVTGIFQSILWFLPGIFLGHPLIDVNALGLSLLPLPVMLAIAIVRHQLFDIDVIIRRTLVYTTLTTVLALVYFGGVIVLQQIFRALTGQASDIAIILSTLGIATLSVPLRNRIQQVIDRRFYRRKYDAAQVLALFAATVRDEVDLGRLTDELQSVVEDTMRPEHVSLWLKR